LGHSSFDVKSKLGSKIFGHNLIRLLHAETGSYLHAGPSFQGSVPEVVLKRYFGENEEESKSVNSIKEAEYHLGNYPFLQNFSRPGVQDWTRI
jgi:hypothetical protein